MCALLDCFPVPAMVLNQERQLIAANQKLTTLLGRPAEAILGLRMGEAFRCIHSGEEPGGCGTSVFCRMCGAAKAILGCWSDRVPNTEECRLTCHSPQGWHALDLRIMAAPLNIGADRFTVLSLMDVTDEKRRMVLEQIFFHDVLNSASGIHGILQVLPDLAAADVQRMLRLAGELSDQLLEEIRGGRDLGAAERGDLRATFRTVAVRPFLERICALYGHLPLAGGKRIEYTCSPEAATVTSDESLLGRVIGNLIKNALEASSLGQAVTVNFDGGPPPRFSVHNQGAMPEAVKLQIFQRSFSTKAGYGRGIGTYSVKMLAERYLKGSVTFRSEPGEGTTFTVSLPPGPAEVLIPKAAS
ncbi:MAG TPA: HAMP domain-containing sensor histidine kinase [Candidatus Limnocylindrales bacterium]|nr:HAMP domain-containing sensor histidine kinase [Candidatus Limnocylindrales bacterium]